MENEKQPLESMPKSYPYIVIVKNTSDEPQDAYIFDATGKLNSSDIVINSGNKDVSYQEMIMQIEACPCTIGETIITTIDGGFIEKAFIPKNMHMKHFIKDADGVESHKIIPVVMSIMQNQSDRVLCKEDLELDENSNIKVRMQGWTRLRFLFYPSSRRTEKLSPPRVVQPMNTKP